MGAESQLLLAEVGTKPDVCGVGIVGPAWRWTGGYSYLHRDVPLVWGLGTMELDTVNYLIVHQAAGARPGKRYNLWKTLGEFDLFRREVRPFTEQHIELVESFAVQAAIAINNVQQFREVQERLEREAATSEILEVISRSRDDDGPVFDVVLENAARL